MNRVIQRQRVDCWIHSGYRDIPQEQGPGGGCQVWTQKEHKKNRGLGWGGRVEAACGYWEIVSRNLLQLLAAHCVWCEAAVGGGNQPVRGCQRCQVVVSLTKGLSTSLVSLIDDTPIFHDRSPKILTVCNKIGEFLGTLWPGQDFPAIINILNSHAQLAQNIHIREMGRERQGLKSKTQSPPVKNERSKWFN